MIGIFFTAEHGAIYNLVFVNEIFDLSHFKAILVGSCTSCCGSQIFFFQPKVGAGRGEAKLLWIHQEIALPGRGAWVEESQLCLVTPAFPASAKAGLVVSACTADASNLASLLSTAGCALSLHIKILWPLGLHGKGKKKNAHCPRQEPAICIFTQ